MQQPIKKPRTIPWVALISIAVLLAVVAAVLIPSYGDYADRSQVAEAMSLLGGTRTPLAEYYANHKKWPSSLAGKSVRLLSADGGKNWLCRAGTVAEKSLPTSCRASQ